MNPEGKRTAILAAGETLFALQGFTGTSMAEIAAQADVAVGTLYRLYADKQALLTALHVQMEDRFTAVIKQSWASTDEPSARFDAMIDAILNEVEAVGAIMPMYTMTRDVMTGAGFIPGSKMIEVIQTNYARGVRKGEFIGYDPKIAASIAHGMVEGAMRARTTSTRKKVASELKALFRRAFLKV